MKEDVGDDVIAPQIRSSGWLQKPQPSGKDPDERASYRDQRPHARVLGGVMCCPGAAPAKLYSRQLCGRAATVLFCRRRRLHLHLHLHLRAGVRPSIASLARFASLGAGVDDLGISWALLMFLGVWGLFNLDSPPSRHHFFLSSSPLLFSSFPFPIRTALVCRSQFRQVPVVLPF